VKQPFAMFPSAGISATADQADPLMVRFDRVEQMLLAVARRIERLADRTEDLVELMRKQR
jgi:hypothetical protein